ncbi:MAG: YgiT-type zinc finger protein [Candidatus Aminicenantes bacterium]|nr:YgiT-type zinc finger protein [Candidatus Aminicenantes bacterium]NIM78774.1 YgiT-type zinc finger protein [Candidatus Aminicenantes bacterium]NIN18029.1 YgiT-type zinc finger protein [Candidatus Aminicenantes bacterium]NIN41929.1 YgiT-type zinc finger protein [Candidatus Aminicenantes bacterium]NIN84684.1 YgiT-type zinc finger protein [Candidatus Aminicenantes bacterium]
MKCVICKSPDIKKKKVQEEIKKGEDIVLIPLEILVCFNCGERYYDRKAMRKIEEAKQRLTKHELQIKEIGKVFLAEAV